MICSAVVVGAAAGLSASLPQPLRDKHRDRHRDNTLKDAANPLACNARSHARGFFVKRLLTGSLNKTLHADLANIRGLWTVGRKQAKVWGPSLITAKA